jgi:hypothetical protein
VERFDMDGENPEPPEPEEDYADVPDDRVDPHWRPASGARMTDEEWGAAMAQVWRDNMRRWGADPRD